MQILILDEAARSRLMGLLDAKSEAHDTMRCDEMQGFMMALLSGPDALSPANWLPETLGKESLFDAKEHTEVGCLMMAMAANMRMKFSKRILPDLWFYEDEANNPGLHTWYNAYLYALGIVPTGWFGTIGQEEFEDLFYPTMASDGIHDDEENGKVILRLNEKELTQLESDLPYALLDIYRYWQAIINKP